MGTLNKSDLSSEQPEQHGEKLSDLADLVVECRSQLYRFILRRVRDPIDAEDILQQTLFEAVRGIAAFRGESKLSTWLYGIASLMITNFMSRSPNYRFRWDMESVLESNLDYSVDPDKTRTLQNRLERVHHHVNQLPDDLRETISLIAVEEMTYEEVAEKLAIPIGTVRSRVSRIRALLCERIEAEDEPNPEALDQCAAMYRQKKSGYVR